MAIRKTVRQQIIANLYAILKDMKDPETNERVWNNILRENLDAIDATQFPCVGMTEGDEETTQQMWPTLVKHLTVFVEFKFENKIGVDVYDQFNYYVGILQATMVTDKTIGGVAYNIQEVHNAPQIVDRDDLEPGGVFTLLIEYRHKNSDPYTRI